MDKMGNCECGPFCMGVSGKTKPFNFNSPVSVDIIIKPIKLGFKVKN